MEIKVENLATQLIKPSSPTSPHHRFVKLSLADQLSPSIHTAVVLFYGPPLGPKNGDPQQLTAPDGHEHAIAIASSCCSSTTSPRLLLKKSLSEVLTKFYPYAGRIQGNHSVECTDDGAQYMEAEVDACLADMLGNRRDELASSLIPLLMPSAVQLEELETTPLVIQVNFFRCGGVALAVLGSHKIMDAVALSYFIRSWATTAAAASQQSKADQIPVVDFGIPSSLYPPSDLLNSLPIKFGIPEINTLTMRYVFDASSIAALKLKAPCSYQPITRVLAVSALIWKCAMKATRSSSKSSSSVLGLAVDTRRRREPPLPETVPGNNATSLYARKNYDENSEMVGPGDLVDLMNNGLKEFCDHYVKKLQGSEEMITSALFESVQKSENLFKKDDIDLFYFSSWCGLKIYEADFGWGKPKWVGFPRSKLDNIVMLMDTKEGDGVEAWVTLTEQHMAAFQQDQELLLFAKSQKY